MSNGAPGNTSGRRAGRPRRVDQPRISRKRQIHEAAIKVFAEKGFHAARVSDIASQAGVAHGLVYHYFSSKEEVLTSIFRWAWQQLEQGLNLIQTSDETASDKLAATTRLMLGSYRLAPDLFRVVVLEVTRSGHLRGQVSEIAQGFELIETMIRNGQQSGEFRDDIDAALISYMYWGVVDEVITGWVFKTLPSGEEDVSIAERAVVEFVLGGLHRGPDAR